MIPPSFIQDLLARVDVVEVVGRYVTLKKAGQNYLGLCPFHGEKTPSFTVSPTKQFFHCFGCGANGTAIGFLMQHAGMGFIDAVKDLAQQAGMTLPELPARAAAAQQRSRALSDVLAEAADFYRAQLKETPVAIDYLKARGLTGAIAARYGLGYAPDTWQGLRAAMADYDDARLVEAGLVIADEGKRYDRFRGRVMFPIRTTRGAVIGFGARVLGAGEPKYLNSPETPVFHKGQELYGLFEAREAIRSAGRAIVCEGYMDVIQLAQAGFQEAVAALGTAVTAAHVTTLLRLTDHVVFAFDGDSAGRKAARRALEATLPVIADGQRAAFVLLPEGQDPDSLIGQGGPAAFEAELAQALPLSRFLLRVLTPERGLGEAEDRASLLAAARPLVTGMKAGALRLQLLHDLAQAARTPLEDLESLFGLQRPRAPRPARPPALARRTPHPGHDQLLLTVLRHLLAHPALAHEFDEPITAELLEDEGVRAGQIVEVWRAAGAGEGGETAARSAGALLEGLAASPHIDEYRSLSARDLAFDTSVEAARAEIRAVFIALELERVKAELAGLMAGGLTDANRAAMQRLSERQARLMAARREASAAL